MTNRTKASLDDSERVRHKYPIGYNQSLGTIKKLRARLENAIRVQNNQKPKIRVQCTSQAATKKGCGKWSAIGTLIYIQTHWYVEPYSCSGGAYWKSGEGAWICPFCNHFNRLYVSLDVTALKPYFNKVEDTYER